MKNKPLSTVVFQAACVGTFFSGVFLGESALANAPVAIVVDSASSNPFGNYLGEIMKAEGFGGVQTMSLATLTSTQLSNYQTILLAECTLTSSQAQMFTNYVSAGGNLIAMRPDSKLNSLFGITSNPGSISEAYIKINTDTPIGAGLESRTMKIHGTANYYKVAPTATKLASVYTSSNYDSGYTAAVKTSYGAGQAVAFSYDLAKSIVYTRQGNPAWANQNRDGDVQLRPSDLFYDAAGSNHWNDITKADILQADEQMRMLTHTVETVTSKSMPLPRLWYFPDMKKSVLVWTGDQDNGSTTTIDNELNAVNTRGGNASIYLLGQKPSQSQYNAYIANGHEIGVHVNDGYQTPPSATWASMNSSFSTQYASYYSAYPNATTPRSIRTHGVKWVSQTADGQPEFAAQAMIEQSYGVQIDFNYYWEGGKYPQLGQSGYTIGSGLPMRFASSAGQIIDVFQADTQLTDEGWNYGSLYTDQAFEAYQRMLNDSINNGKYAWIVANFHPVSWEGTHNCQVEGVQILDYAVANGIPIWSGADMNSFLRMRDAASFQDIQFSGGRLSFSLASPVIGVGNLTLMVPYNYNDQYLSDITLNGLPTSYQIETIAGYDYALFTVGIGTQLINALYVPEPQTFLLLTTAFLAIAGYRRLKRSLPRPV